MAKQQTSHDLCGFGFTVTADQLEALNPKEIKHGQIWVDNGLRAHVIVDPARAPYLNIGNSELLLAPLKTVAFRPVPVPPEIRRQFLYAGTMDIVVPIGETPRRST